MRLSKRLAAVAEQIRPGVRVADIGTDHARLPVWLVRNNMVSAAIAVDIADGPLAVAREYIKRCGLSGRITVIRSDGLSALDLTQIDDIIIAGMGGETIAEILEQGLPRIDGKRLILQPMSRPERLKARLMSAGIQIISEQIIEEGRRKYTLFLAQK